MSQFQSKAFKSLKAQWYQKLKASGFEDIEDTTSDKEYLKSWHSSVFQTKYDPQSFEIKRIYYESARQFLELNFSNHQQDLFKSKDAAVWELHAEGQSLREIAAALHLKVYQVHRIVLSLKEKMLKSR